MPATDKAGTWIEDREIVEWLLGVAHDRPGYSGKFLKAIASAARHADGSNYQLMRPTLLLLKSKYPQFSLKLGKLGG
jgi:hypothetical protein